MTMRNITSLILEKLATAARKTDVKYPLAACLIINGEIFSNPIANRQSDTDNKGAYKCSSLHAEYSAIKAMFPDLTYMGQKGWARKSELKGIDFSKEN